MAFLDPKIPKSRVVIFAGMLALVVGWVLFGPRLNDLTSGLPDWTKYVIYGVFLAIFLVGEVILRRVREKRDKS